METSESRQARPVCPSCGHENIPGAAFCARCGESLTDDEVASIVADPSSDDTQVTTTYAPIGTAAGSRSPWAPPGDGAGQTGALPLAEPYADTAPDVAPIVPARPVHRQSIRGFFLGLVAVLLIAVALALYVYAAWLGDSARDTIDGWLPWLS